MKSQSVPILLNLSPPPLSPHHHHPTFSSLKINHGVLETSSTIYLAPFKRGNIHLLNNLSLVVVSRESRYRAAGEALKFCTISF